MKEIEILVQVYSPIDEVVGVLDKFQYIGNQETNDVYYYDPLRSNLKPNSKNQIDECLRLRTKGNSNCITYKTDRFDGTGKWLYSDEYETYVEDIVTIKEIFKKLGFSELITIHNVKREYKYLEYNIDFETVKDLGNFIEIEYCTTEDIDVKLKKQEMLEFLNSLDLEISEELNMGKPEMLINKFNISVD